MARESATTGMIGASPPIMLASVKSVQAIGEAAAAPRGR